MIPQYYRTHVIVFLEIGSYAVTLDDEQVAIVSSTCEGRSLIDRLNWGKA